MTSLIISGSGFSIFNQIGALQVLFSSMRPEFNKQIKHKLGPPFANYVGTSSGALLATLLTMEFDPFSIEEWFVSNYQMLNLLLTPNPNTIMTSGSLFNAEDITHFITSIIQASPIYKRKFVNINPELITFKQLYDVTNRGLFINATNISDERQYSPGTTTSPGRPEIFSAITSPSVSVVSAIQASMSLLPLIPPTKIGDRYYLDGAYTADFPLSLYERKSPTYYEKWYSKTLPIDPARSVGIWYIDPVFQSKINYSEWNLSSLISSVANIANFGILNQLELFDARHKHKPIYTDIIYLSGSPVSAFPAAEKIPLLVKMGKDQTLNHVDAKKSSYKIF